MLQLRIHAKLLVAFVLVLLPVLGLLVVDLLSDLHRTREDILHVQFMTAQAVAGQASETLDAAMSFGWAVSKDPLLRTLDPQQLDSHLKELAAQSPLYDSVAVFDATGINRGWSNPTSPDEPRLWIGDRPYFQKVMTTNAPVISEVLELRRPIRTGLLVSTPVRGPDGKPIAVFNVVLRTDLLEQRYVGARLQPGQALFLADQNGRLAFHTGLPELSFEQSNAYAHFEPLRIALRGMPSRLSRFTSPLQGDERLGAFVPVPRYPWAVGVTIPYDLAMAPLYERARTRLVAFGGILLLSILLAAVLARFFTRPVRQLQIASKALGRGEMHRRVHISTGDELEDLGTTFNEMATRLSQRQVEVETLRAQAEHQAQQLAAIIASVPDAIFLANPDGQLADANPAGLRLLGLGDRAELGGASSMALQLQNLRHPDGHPMAPEELPIHRALAGETFTDVEVLLHGPDGQERLLSVHGAPVRDVSGKLIFGEVVVRDITRRRREEEELAWLLERELALARIGQALVSEMELERIARVVIEQSHHALGADGIGLWLADPERQELSLLTSHRLTAAAEEGLRRVAFQAPLLTAKAAREERIQVIEDALAGGAPTRSGWLAREGGYRGMVAVPLHSHERLVGVMSYFTREPRPISSRALEFHTMVGRLFAVAIEKARLFQELRAALRLREEFMSAAAHELKTPVTSIQTWAELLLNLEVLTPRQQKGLTTIARNSRRISRLVEHLFAAVRMAPGPPKLERQRFELHTLVREQAEKFSRTTENPIHVDAMEALFIHAERQLLGEVVAHLLENAVRYSPPGGPVELRARRVGSEAVVSVHDQGPGIPPERQPHVFEPLYEPLPPGAPGYTGVVHLGLHLSRQIIEAHGGRIWVESHPGEGSTFCFSLPLSPAPLKEDSHTYS
ncbi:ATP-binding protein [Archangium lansingense]|uniref:histidine kinase n=1 Tax=Archangium lansingense TaxID=2995310 RepID=A0ABT4AB57_9BACT|nr:cache domain-containing protein [Archangium lansinium]MCY1078913.1 cache domain-containing protein [Archangium lansinium]